MLSVPVSIGERLWGIPWGIPRDLTDLVDSWLTPTVFHVLVNGRVARLKRAWSRSRVGSRGGVGLRDRGGSCDWSRGTEASKGSRDESRATFPRSRAFFSGSRGGIFIFTIWL